MTTLALDSLGDVRERDRSAMARSHAGGLAPEASAGAADGPVSQANLPPHAEIAHVPRVTIHAYCESPTVAATLETAARDRLMARAGLAVHAGGIDGAVAAYQNAPTPNLIIVENHSAELVLARLDGLAEVCDPGTKVMVIGYSNDIGFYRELMKRGVSEYAIAPLDPVGAIAAISGIYRGESAGKLGKTYAFIGAKGGVGSSTVAHNVGWSIARRSQTDVVVADLDLPFGTVGLDFNLDGGQGIAEFVQDAARLDQMLLDRLLTECGDHLSLLTAPATLDLTHDLDESVFDPLLEVAQSHVPTLVLDLPHVWSAWARKVLVAADDIVITAAPDLANLRNAKNLVAFLKNERPHDPPPKLVLNQVGVPKRPEIKPKDFVTALGIEPLATIAFEPKLFGTAANNGQMVGQVAAKARPAEAFAGIAQSLGGREPAKRRRGGFQASALMGLIKRKRAAAGR
ncbi:MAG TPA: CtpF protein [Microvirga sp.]|jgi:pilus assembly protein CpaE|nr:CtpF protein [Microvirga sp.]